MSLRPKGHSGQSKLPAGGRPVRTGEVGPVASRDVAPGVDAPVRAAGGLLPFRFARERDAPAGFQPVPQTGRSAGPFAQRRLQPPAIGQRIGPGDGTDRVVGPTAQRLGNGGVAGGVGEGAELRHGDLVAADGERGQVDGALGLPCRPALVLEGPGIDGRVAAHGERSGRNLDEPEQIVVRKEPGVGAESLQRVRQRRRPSRRRAFREGPAPGQRAHCESQRDRNEGPETLRVRSATSRGGRGRHRRRRRAAESPRARCVLPRGSHGSCRLASPQANVHP